MAVTRGDGGGGEITSCFPPRVPLDELTACRFLDLYQKFQVVIVTPPTSSNSTETVKTQEEAAWGLNEAKRLCQQFSLQTQESWCLESSRQLEAVDREILRESWCRSSIHSTSNRLEQVVGTEEEEQEEKVEHSTWYLSFIVQEKADNAPADNSHSLSGFQQMLQSLPCPSVPSFFHPCNVKHSNCVWFFVGCNPHPSEPLDGRAELVDSVTNDGTWHAQVLKQKALLL